MTGRTKGNNVFVGSIFGISDLPWPSWPSDADFFDFDHGDISSGLRFRILEAQMETGTPYMLYKAIICPTCLFLVLLF